MRPLPLAALLLTAAPWARAQTRAGTVDAGLNAGAPNVTSSLSAGGAPQLIALSLSGPSLGSPGLSPAGLTPVPAIMAAPYAAISLAQGPHPAALPASFISPAPVVALKPAPLADAVKLAHDGAPADLDKASIGELLTLTKRLFGEADGAGLQSSYYLRPGEPLKAGAAEVSRYRAALGARGAKEGGAELRTLVAAAEGLARSAGVTVEAGEREGAPILKITPLRDGHRLNRLAWDMRKNFDSEVEYAPNRTSGGVAAYNSTERALFLPDFGRDDSFEAILHESRHAAFGKRLRRGDLSPFHAALLAYRGRSIAPHAESYDKYMSLEEVSTHVKTLLHALLRARREPAGSGATDARKYAYQLVDVMRSAEINLFQLERMLKAGGVKSYLVSGPSWPEIAGGHWEAINLPHAILVLPVLDAPPAPKRGLWDRLFKDEPPSAAALAAGRHAAALRPLLGALSVELEPFLAALKGGKPDLEAARLSALRMTALAADAEKNF